MGEESAEGRNSSLLHYFLREEAEGRVAHGSNDSASSQKRHDKRHDQRSDGSLLSQRRASELSVLLHLASRIVASAASAHWFPPR